MITGKYVKKRANGEMISGKYKYVFHACVHARSGAVAFYSVLVHHQAHLSRLILKLIDQQVQAASTKGCSDY
jgi:hypothetical protein